MRVLRLRHGGLDYFAEIVDDETARLWSGAPWGGGTATDRLVPLRDRPRLCPVVPSKIVCVGRNYRDHAAELGNPVPAEPLLFLKPPSALIGHEAVIDLPSQSERIEHEGELGVVIGRALRGSSPADARRAIYGLTCVNDITARDLQRRDVQFTRGKGFDTFCPVGPHIETDCAPDDLRIEVTVNGQTRQDGRTTQMLWPVDRLLSFISSVMTLEPGDLVCTGTPSGVGPLMPDDVVEVHIEGIGVLRNAAKRAT